MRVQFVNRDRHPLYGHLVYTRYVGCKDPQTTWVDCNGDIPNTNPIVLDSMGEASIYMLDGRRYDIEIEDSQGIAVTKISDISCLQDYGVMAITIHD